MIPSSDKSIDHAKLETVELALEGIERTLVPLYHFQRIHKVDNLRRDSQLESVGGKTMLPYPPHVTSLSTIGTEDALLGGPDILLDPCTKVGPNSGEWKAISYLWRLRS